MFIATEEWVSGQAGLENEKQVSALSYWPEASFRQIFLENYGRIAGVLFRVTGDWSRAEELASEAFWRLYRQRPPRDAKSNAAGWLYRTATHLGIDSLRAEARRQRYEQEAGKAFLRSTPDPLEDVLRAEKARRVRRVLGALRPAQAQILILRTSGFSYQELAEILGVKRGSVGTMLIRAEAEFRKRYLRLHGKKEER